MKKLLILSIALLAAVPGVEAQCNTCTSSQNVEQQCERGSKCACAKAKVCTKCKKYGKRSCKCTVKHKTRYHKGSRNIFKETGDVIAAPFRWLSGDDNDQEEANYQTEESDYSNQY